MNKENSAFNISEDDVIMLESLVKSPAFGALKRVLERYRAECSSALLTATETHKMFQLQGRIIGLQVIENLPGLVVAQRQQRLKKADAATKKPQPKEVIK